MPCTKDDRPRGVKQFVALATIALLSACASIQPSGVQGTVIDVSTNPPTGLGGTRLLFLFRGSESVFPESVDFCDGASIGMSGPDGFFDWPSRIGREVDVIAYKPGYVFPRVLGDRKRHEVYLARNGTHDAVMKNFHQLERDAGCVNIGTQSQPIADFLIPILRDAESEAKNAQDRNVVRDLEQTIALYNRKAN
jgi:hypothetical protein